MFHLEVTFHAQSAVYNFHDEESAGFVLDNLSKALEDAKDYKLNNPPKVFKFEDMFGENIIVLDKVESARIYDSELIFEHNKKLQDKHTQIELERERALLELRKEYK